MLNKLNEIKLNINNYDDLFLTLEKELPNLFIDSDTAYQFFNGEYENEFLLDQIIICYEIKTYLEKNREHIKKSLKTNKVPYDLYLKRNIKTALTKRNFNDLYNSMNFIALDNRFLAISSKAQRILEKLNSLNISKESQIKVLDTIITDYYSGIQNATKYLNKDDSFEDCYKFLQQISNSVYKDKSLAVEAVLYLTFDENYNDASLETTFIYNNFLKRLNNDDISENISFIKPSGFFIRKLYNDPRFRNYKITFYLSDENLINCFKYAYKKENIAFDHIKSITNKPAKAVLSDVLFIFGNNIDDSAVIEKIIEPIVTLSYQNNKIVILDRDYRLCKENNVSSLISRLKIVDLSLLPGDINNSTLPARKSIIEAINSLNNDTFVVSNYKLNKDGQIQSITSKISKLIVNNDVYNKFNTSFRKLFREIDYTNSDNKRNSYRYEFSKEIIIKYSLSNKTRLRAEMINPFAGNNSKKTIDYTRVSTVLKNNTDPEEWLENIYPFATYRDSKLKSTVQQETSNLLKGYQLNSMTFKTFLYIYKDEINFIPISFKSLYFDMLASELSDIYLDHIKEEQIQNTIDHLLEKYSNISSQYHLINIFKNIFGIAVSHKLLKTNPADNLVKNTEFNDSTIFEIKEALAINYLNLERRRNIIDDCNKNLTKKPGISVGVLLRLLLAMLPKEICALNWGAFVKQDDFYYLTVDKEVTKDDTIIAISNQRKIRKIPVGPFLTEVLLKEKKRQIDHFKLSEKDMCNRSIIIGKKTIEPAFKLLSTEILYKESQKLLKKYDIPDEFITIPTNNNVAVDVDLTNTRGDIFRTNYRHYIAFKQLCSHDIYAYLVGIQGLDVFSDHYCDYKNSTSLKKIYLIQKRIEEVLLNG